MSSSISLKVSEALRSDVGFGRARLNETARRKLGVHLGDIVEIKGTRTTGAIVWRARPEDNGRDIIRVDSLIRNNAGTSLGERVVVSKCEVREAKNLMLSPITEQEEQIKFSSGISAIIRRAITNRPLYKGDTIIIQGIALTMGNTLPFGVVKTEPAGIVKVTERTEIHLKETAIKQVDLSSPRISYEDIGGLNQEVKRVREMIELPLKHPEIFDRLGITPPKGVLLYGPPGTGKTLIAKAVANESGAKFFSIQGPEIMSKYYGESEKQIRKKFEEAEQHAPSIIFIDELDSIAPKREDVYGEVERRVVAQMLTLMDGLNTREKVIVIAATNRIDAIDPALRRHGRFDREIEIGVPTREGRREILDVHARSMPLSKDVNLDQISEKTHGFVGADLAALCREAAMKTLSRYIPKLELDQTVPFTVLEKMEVSAEDFSAAMKEIEPSAMREVLVEIPKVKWEDVGGLVQVKQGLRESVEWPLKYPESFKRMGISPSRGILLFGPPGTGKTLMVKAVAHESELNFISIKGPEVLSKWVGESEKAIRNIFKKAKQVTPCIVFFDEIDAIAAMRGAEMGSNVSDRIVNQLLTSLDGLEDIQGILVIAATNRPDMVDSGLLRSGRFDKLLHVTIPEKEARKQIFQIYTRKMPLGKDVDIDKMVKRTEGYVGADIEAICREAGLHALRKSIKSRTVTQKDFDFALEQARPSVDKFTIDYFNKLEKSLLTSATTKKYSDVGVSYR